MGKIAGKHSPFGSFNAVADVSFTIGAETGGNTIAVTMQFKDANGKDLAHAACVYAYFSDDAAGQTPLATASSGAVAIGTDGLLQALEAKKQFMLTCEADGDADITIIEAGAKTMYLNVVLPDGTIKTSGAITFA
jgi:hypothetical protein